MNEDETRAELIDPKLKESGWGVIDGTKINRNFPITLGRIQPGNIRASPFKAASHSLQCVALKFRPERVI